MEIITGISPDEDNDTYRESRREEEENERRN